MASLPPDLRVDEELPVALFHPESPITRDFFVLRYGDYNLDVDEKEWRKAVAKVVQAMGSLPVLPQAAAASGRFEGGCHSPALYAYDDDLASCTWREGWKVIDDFDWGLPSPESPQSFDEDICETRLLTPAVEESLSEALPSDGGSSVDAHNTPTGFHHIDTDPSVYGEILHSEPETAALIAAPSLSPLYSEELAPSALPSPAPLIPLKASEDRQESSSTWIVSPPSKATIGPGTIIFTTPFEDAHSRSPPELLPASSALPGNLVEAESASPLNMVADTARVVDGIQDAAEEIRQVLKQPAATEEEVTSLSHIPDRAVTRSNTIVEQPDDDMQDEGQHLTGEENLEGSQTPFSPNSLFDDDSDEPGEDQQPDGQEMDVVYQGPGTPEHANVPARASSAPACIIANRINRSLANDAINLPLSEDDIAVQILEHFELEEGNGPSPRPSEEHVSDVPASTKVPSMPSNAAEPVTACEHNASSEVDLGVDKNCGLVTEELSLVPALQEQASSGSPDIGPQLLDQKAPEQGTEGIHMETDSSNDQDNDSMVVIESNSDSASRVILPVPPPQDEPPTQTQRTAAELEAAQALLTMDARMPRPDNLEQAVSSEVILPQDTQNADLSGATGEPEKVAGPREEAGIASSPDHATRPTPFKLKIGSQFWNTASPVPRGGDETDTDAVGDTPAATPASGNKGDELWEDAFDQHKTKSFKGSEENSHEPAELPNAASPLANAFPDIPTLPVEEGTFSDTKEATPLPLLPGLEEHAAAASSSTAAPSSPAMALQDESSPWIGNLLDQELDLPPSPFKAEPVATRFPALKQENPHDALGTPPTTAEAETFGEVLPGVASTSELEHVTTDSKPVPSKIVPKKRARAAATRKMKATSTAAAEYKAWEESESEYEAPAKKKSKKSGFTRPSVKPPASFRASTVASRGKGSMKLAVPPKGLRGKKAAQQPVEEEIVDREDTDAEPHGEEKEQIKPPKHTTAPAPSRPPYWALETRYGPGAIHTRNGEVEDQPQQEQEADQDQEQEQETSLAIPPSSKANPTTKAKLTPKPPTNPPPPAPPTTASSQRKKYGFKPPTGRKRKAAPTDAPPAELSKRQTRMASAAQEEAQRQREIEGNVARRTRGARRSDGV